MPKVMSDSPVTLTPPQEQWESKCQNLNVQQAEGDLAT